MSNNYALNSERRDVHDNPTYVTCIGSCFANALCLTFRVAMDESGMTSYLHFLTKLTAKEEKSNSV